MAEKSGTSFWKLVFALLFAIVALPIMSWVICGLISTASIVSAPSHEAEIANWPSGMLINPAGKPVMVWATLSDHAKSLRWTTVQGQIDNPYAFVLRTGTVVKYNPYRSPDPKFVMINLKGTKMVNGNEPSVQKGLVERKFFIRLDRLARSTKDGLTVSNSEQISATRPASYRFFPSQDGTRTIKLSTATRKRKSRSKANGAGSRNGSLKSCIVQAISDGGQMGSKDIAKAVKKLGHKSKSANTDKMISIALSQVGGFLT